MKSKRFHFPLSLIQGLFIYYSVWYLFTFLSAFCIYKYFFKNSRPVLDEWPFKIETFAQHEDALRVATSLFSLLSQDFKIDKEKWKIVSGM